MSWNRCSRLGLVVLCVALIAAGGVASAVSVANEDVQEEAQPGDEITVSIELEELYTDNEQWELGGQTDLQTATWTVTQYNDGNQVAQDEIAGGDLQGIGLDSSDSDAPDTVTVEVTGIVPEPEEYSYPEQQTFLGIEVASIADGGDNFTVIDTWEVEQYEPGDPGSREAYAALQDADQAMEEADDVSDDIQNTYDQAVASYEAGNWEFAVSLANDVVSQLGGDPGSAESTDGGSSEGSTTTTGGDGSTDGTSGSTDGSSSTTTDGTSTTTDGTTDETGGTTDGTGGTTDGTSGTTDGTSSTSEDTTDGATGVTSDDTTDGESTSATGEASVTGETGTAAGSEAAGGEGGDDGSEDSDDDDGGILPILMYAFLGLLILAAVGGGVYYYQQQQGPSRDPLG